MTTISLVKTVKYLVITPITNLDFEDASVKDYSQLLEIEVGTNMDVCVFNAKSQIVESLKPTEIKPYHYYLNNDSVLHKIIHILD